MGLFDERGKRRVLSTLSLAAICLVALQTVAQAAQSTASPRQGQFQSGAPSTAFSFVSRRDGALICKASGKPCTQAQVKALSASYIDQNPRQSIALAKDGSLLCGARSCTAANLPALKKAARFAPLKPAE